LPFAVNVMLNLTNNRTDALKTDINLFFTITAEIHARSLAKFYGQYADRHINLKFVRASANESEKFGNLLS